VLDLRVKPCERPPPEHTEAAAIPTHRSSLLAERAGNGRASQRLRCRNLAGAAY